jgi:8-amino-7-oxononanoate synthase
MIYHDKGPAIHPATEDMVQVIEPSHQPEARKANHRVARSKAAAAAPDLALLQKVKDFKNAQQIRALGLYPYFRTIASAQDTEVIIEGQKVLMLGSNSYLGLTNHPRIKEAALGAVTKYGTGCAGSRFLNGSLDIHLELENVLARLVGKEAVLLYSTGFQVNLGVISSLVGKGEYVIGDKSNHASIVEGCLCSQGKFLRFPHKDMAALEARLQGLDPSVGKLVVVDGVFSMEGDIIQLPELARICRDHRAVLMVDDAHSIGVLGKTGSGTASHFGLTDQVHLIMGTFSKSLASLGGFIASDSETIDYLKHHSRPLIFSASMSPANVAAVLEAVRIMVAEPERIARLWQNTDRMKQGLIRLGFDLGDSSTPILPVYCRDLHVAFKLCKRLQEEGVFVNPVVSPAVPPGHELIRISLMATHTDKQIDFALEKLGKVGKELGLI